MTQKINCSFEKKTNLPKKKHRSTLITRFITLIDFIIITNNNEIVVRYFDRYNEIESISRSHDSDSGVTSSLA